jgi:RNA polymerase sigma factor (sigma-70 family)
MICTQEEFNKLVTDNYKFAYDVVNKEFGKYPWHIKEDLNSAAIEGLVYAATKYDPSREEECKFISYAIHWIRYYINEEIRKIYPVKFNQNFIIKRNKVMRCVNEYKTNHNDEMPSVDYISGCVKMSPKVVKNILNINGGENFDFISINAPTETKENDSENLTESTVMQEYFNNAVDNSFTQNIELNDILDNLKKEVDEDDFNIFVEYYMNGENISDIAKKHNLKFPSSAAYIIKKCEKKCKEIANN